MISSALIVVGAIVIGITTSLYGYGTAAAFFGSLAWGLLVLLLSGEFSQ